MIGQLEGQGDPDHFLHGTLERFFDVQKPHRQRQQRRWQSSSRNREQIAEMSITNAGECRQIRAETLEQRFEFRNNVNEQDCRNDECDNNYSSQDKRAPFLTFFLIDSVFLFVCRNLFEQCFERARLFTGRDKIYIQDRQNAVGVLPRAHLRVRCRFQHPVLC